MSGNNSLKEGNGADGGQVKAVARLEEEEVEGDEKRVGTSDRFDMTFNYFFLCDEVGDLN